MVAVSVELGVAEGVFTAVLVAVEDGVAVLAVVSVGVAVNAGVFVPVSVAVGLEVAVFTDVVKVEVSDGVFATVFVGVIVAV